jgi:hypothetical protein
MLHTGTVSPVDGQPQSTCPELEVPDSNPLRRFIPPGTPIPPSIRFADELIQHRYPAQGPPATDTPALTSTVPKETAQTS